jgi:hypothetical protein
VFFHASTKTVVGSIVVKQYWDFRNTVFIQTTVL